MAYFGSSFVVFLVVVINVSSVIAVFQNNDHYEGGGNEIIGLTAAQIARLRGYDAAIHPVDTQPGYRINLVNIKNPTLAHGIPTKNPVLFIHGIATSAACYMVNADKARPLDLSNLNAENLSFRELEELLLNDPAAKSLPFLLSNFGHDVWLMNRRSTLESQLLSPIRTRMGSGSSKSLLHRNETMDHENDLVNFGEPIEQNRFSRDIFGSRFRSTRFPRNNDWESPSFNETIQSQLNGSSWVLRRRILEKTMRLLFDKHLSNKIYNREYWDYSMDEQVEFDIPNLVDYILAHSNFPKVSLIAHSLGGAIAMMTLADKPGIARKLGNCALLAPAAELGYTYSKNPLIGLSTITMPLLRLYKGPVYPTVLEPILHNLLTTACKIGFLRDTICFGQLVALLGPGVDQLDLAPANMASFFDTSSANELLHLLQAIVRGRMHKFSYNPIRNKLIYGQFGPPPYDYSRVRLRSLSIWTGNTDALITPTDTRILFKKIRVPVERRYITGTDIEFNHMAFLLHYNVTTLFNIPLIKSLHTPLSVKLQNPTEHFIGDDDFFDENVGLP